MDFRFVERNAAIRNAEATYDDIYSIACLLRDHDRYEYTYKDRNDNIVARVMVRKTDSGAMRSLMIFSPCEVIRKESRLNPQYLEEVIKSR